MFLIWFFFAILFIISAGLTLSSSPLIGFVWRRKMYKNKYSASHPAFSNQQLTEDSAKKKLIFGLTGIVLGLSGTIWTAAKLAGSLHTPIWQFTIFVAILAVFVILFNEGFNIGLHVCEATFNYVCKEKKDDSESTNRK